MSFGKILIVCFTVFSCTLSQKQKVAVDVYYEGLCPDARKFITKQLYPNLQTSLSKYVELKLIPYGKATTTKTPTGDYIFKCHHGPNECYANKIHACAINFIDNGENTPGLGYNNNTLPFINCLMSTENAKNDSLPNTDACAVANKIPNIKDIKDCARDTRGSLHLAEFGELTNSLQNPLRSVPTIVYNRHYSEEASTTSNTKFAKVLCDYIKEDKPKECSGNNLTISIGLMLLAIVLRRCL